jgi:hypothetical protein
MYISEKLSYALHIIVFYIILYFTTTISVENKIFLPGELQVCIFIGKPNFKEAQTCCIITLCSHTGRLHFIFKLSSWKKESTFLIAFTNSEFLVGCLLPMIN